jgi:UPF0755 protein
MPEGRKLFVPNVAGFLLKKVKPVNTAAPSLKKYNFFVKRLLISLLLVIFIASSFVIWYGYEVYYNPQPAKMLVQFSITPHESASSVLTHLKSVGLIRSEMAIKIYLHLNQLTQKLKPGGYQLSQGFTPKQIIDELIKGPKDIWVTIPEGWRREQISLRLKTSLTGFDADRFNQITLGLEGQLFPDTYLFPAQATPSDVLRIFLSNFTKKTKLDPKDLKDRDILTLASLVEREAKIDTDRQIIAGILVKRLNAGWPLQVDASIQYVQGSPQDWWPNVSDTKLPSLYNTYIYTGLPPGPICNPGLASIQAVQNPQDTPYWYYLTGLDGITRYAVDLDRHNQNIDKYLRP